MVIIHSAEGANGSNWHQVLNNWSPYYRGTDTHKQFHNGVVMALKQQDTLSYTPEGKIQGKLVL